MIRAIWHRTRLHYVVRTAGTSYCVNCDRCWR